MKQILRLREGYGLSNIKRYILYTLLISIGVAWIPDNTARAQDFLSLKGKVLDSVSGSPVAGAHLILTGNFPSFIDVFTDSLGNFNFRGVHIKEGMLKVLPQDSSYQIRELRIGTEKPGPYVIYLNRIANLLDEVEIVSTGFWQVPKERATGSFVHVDNKLLSRSVGSNVLDRLNGVTRGLIFNQASIGNTQLVNQSSMSIRGRSTINANAEPLIILDNFPYEGDINSINPEDIESATVLQDAAAASIWGARAGNGVIVLTSKSGKFEQPLKISVRGDWSISEKPDLYYAPTMPIPEYIETERFLFNQGAWDGTINQIYPYITPAIESLLACRNGHIDSMTMEGQLARLKTQDVRQDLLKYAYRPQALYKTALSLQGGSKNNNYYVSAGYDKNAGDMKNNQTERVNLNARNSFSFFDAKLKLEASILFSKNKDNIGGQNIENYQVLYDKIADGSGNPLSIGGGYNFSGLRQSYIDTAGNGLLLDWNYRPLEENFLDKTISDQTFYQIQTNFSYQFFPGISASINYQYSHSNLNLDRYNDQHSFFVRDIINEFSQISNIGTVTSAIPFGGRLAQSSTQGLSHNFRGQLTLNKIWHDQHQLSALIGFEVNERRDLNRSYANMWGYQPETESYTPLVNTGFYLEYQTGYMNALPLTYDSRESFVNRNRLFFGNASYTYDERYTSTFSIRKDEANIFGVDANKRGRPFWSAGLLWRIQNEPFYMFRWLTKLALRITHGYMGNVSNASAYITSSIASSPNTRTGRIYQTITNPPNPQLGWENVRMTNLALDFSAAHSRLNGSVEYYFKKSSELLSNAPMNPSSGVNTLFGNWSSLKGNGWDVNLQSRNLQGRLRWQSDLLFSSVSEKVTDYKLKPASDRDYLTSGMGLYPIEGRPLYSIYSLAWAGLDNAGQPQGYLDGQISEDYTSIYNNSTLGDYIYHGRATPAVFGSLRNSFSYRGLDLSFNITYKLGYYFRRPGMNYGNLYSTTGYSNAIFEWEYSDRWQIPGDENNTQVPIAQFPVDYNRESFYSISSILVDKGDHIRLNDIRLGYDLPRKLFKRWSIQCLTVYTYVNNVGILWRANKLGIDPDTVPGGSLVYPSPRTYSLGIDVNF